MLTHTLWRALRHPSTEHPLFRRTVLRRLDAIPCLAWGVALIAAPVLLLPALLLIGMTYGLIWAMMIAGLIARERTNGLFELLAVSPLGAFGTSWLICTACVHRGQAFDRIHNFGLWFARIIFALYIVAFTGFGGRSVFTISSIQCGLLWIIMLAVIAYMVIDHLQSIATGCLSGMLAPALSSDRLNARTAAFALFTGAQLAVYLPGSLLIAALFPALNAAFTTGNTLQVIIFLLVIGLTLLAMREAALRLMWQRLLTHLNVGSEEAQTILQRIPR